MGSLPAFNRMLLLSRRGGIDETMIICSYIKCHASIHTRNQARVYSYYGMSACAKYFIHKRQSRPQILYSRKHVNRTSARFRSHDTKPSTIIELLQYAAFCNNNLRFASRSIPYIRGTIARNPADELNRLSDHISSENRQPHMFFYYNSWLPSPS